MGSKDTLTKNYLKRPEIFADAFNYFLFGGEKVIKPKDLKEEDPTEIVVMRKIGKAFQARKCGISSAYVPYVAVNMQHLYYLA